MSIFHRRRAAEPETSAQKDSVEINIAIDGQSYLTGMGASAQELESKINGHLQQLLAFYGQQSAQAAAPDKAQRLERLNASIQGAHSDLGRRIYDRSLLNIAEAYETWAIIAQSSAAWDAAWGVLNKEMLSAIIVISEGKKEILSNAYVELLFARGMHCLRQMKAAPDENTIQGCAEFAINMFLTYLLEVHKLGLSHWQVNDAIKNIHIASAYGAVSEAQMDAVTKQVAAKPSEQSAAGILEQVMADVKAFSFGETDRARLAGLIY